MTDRQHLEQAARAILKSEGDEQLNEACIEMFEALSYTQSIQWWDERNIQFTN